MRNLLLSLLCLFGLQTTRAQYHEVGAMAGAMFFQGDYGERGDFENFYKNVGFTGSLMYYFTFFENYSNLSQYLKLRGDMSVYKVDLQHYGKWVDPSRTSLTADQLRAMRGQVTVGSVGFQVEYFPWMNDDYNRDAVLTPYVALGAHLNYFTNKNWSTMGPIGVPSTTPLKYMDGLRNSNGVQPSVTYALGGRIKVGKYDALIVETRWQVFFYDWVEGMNPNRRLYTENKNMDTAVGITLGYVYYFRD